MATIYEVFLQAQTPRRGIAFDVARTVANREGGLTEPARLGDFSGPPWYSGKSWWAYQLHYGGKGYESWGRSAGMGNSFTTLTKWAPGDPNAWRDAMRYALDRVRAGGWGPWYGAAAAGITGFYGVNRAVPWNGTPDEEWDYKKGTAMATYVFPVQGFVGPVQRHHGVSMNASDLFAPRGTPVRAMVNGVVEEAGFNSIGGWSVYMIGDADTKSLHYYMAHLDSEPLVRAGQRVVAGQLLGYVGDSGNAAGTGTHLHIGIGAGIKNGVGPEGGAGNPWPGNNAVQYLQKVLDVFGSAPVTPAPAPVPAPDLQAEVNALREQLAAANTKLGVLTVNYADTLDSLIKGLADLLVEMRKLRPPQ